MACNTANRERETTGDCKPQAQPHRDSEGPRTPSTWKIKREMMITADTGAGKKEIIPTAHAAKDFFALSADT